MAPVAKRPRGSSASAREAEWAADALEVVLARGAHLAFAGSARLQLVGGGAHVLGSALQPSSAWRALHSPAGGAVLAIEAGEEGARIRLRRLGGPDLSDLDRVRSLDARADAASLSAELRARAGLTLIEHAAVPRGAGAVLPLDWVECARGVGARLRSAPVVLLCGPRNSGKSTFLRLLLNCALESWGTVLLLEADAGQPELSTPGVLALHRVEEALLGPPHTHAAPPHAAPHHPLSARFLGDVTPATDPQGFARAVQSLVSEYRTSENAGTPLVVNTCGWVRGLGSALLAEVVAAAHPDQLVLLKPSGGGGGARAHAQRAAAADEACARADDGDGAADGADADEDGAGLEARASGAGVRLEELGLGQADGAPAPHVRTLAPISTCAHAARALGACGVAAPSAPELRSWKLASYFAACARAQQPASGAHGTPGGPPVPAAPPAVGVDSWRDGGAWRALGTALLHAPVVTVPLAAVRLCLGSESVPASEALRVLNAAVVGLLADPRPLRAAHAPHADDQPDALVALSADARLRALDVCGAAGAAAPRAGAQSLQGAPAAAERAGAGVRLTLLAHAPDCECVGLGIVRAIDVRAGCVHLLTPVPTAALARVNTLVRASVPVPAAMLGGGAGPAGAQPYLTAEALTGPGAGGAAMRSRNNLRRGGGGAN